MTIDRSVITGWMIDSMLRRLRLMTMHPIATITDHPKCSDGMAANWLASDTCGSVL